MSTHRVELQHHFSAPPAVVFAALADHELFGQLWPGRTRRIRTGQDGANGVGSVREIQVGLTRFEETTVTHEPSQLIEYRITRGTPLRDHLGRMELRPDGEGTRLDYSIVFRCPIPLLGGHLARKLKADFEAAIPAWAARLGSAEA